MNDDNLVPFDAMEPDRQRELSRRGGIASGESRRRMKRLRESLKILTDAEYSEASPADVEKGAPWLDGNLYNALYNAVAADDPDGWREVTNLDAMAAKMVENALKGDRRSFMLVMGILEGGGGDGE